MTYVLETAVEAIKARMLLLEVASISDQTPASAGATEQWYFLPQSVPYWTNRPAGLRKTEYANKWRLDIQARLWLAHVSQAQAAANSIQVDTWSYMAAFIAYMEDHRQLNLTGQANISYLDAPGASTESLTGQELGLMVPGQSEYLFLDFTIQVPILIYEVT